MYILFVHHVLFLSSNHLEISINISLLLAFFHFRLIFFTSVGFRLPSVCVRLHSFASVCV